MMRNFSSLALAPAVQVSILSPAFQREARNEVKIISQQQQYDRYAGLSPAQMQEVIRQQQM